MVGNIFSLGVTSSSAVTLYQVWEDVTRKQNVEEEMLQRGHAQAGISLPFKSAWTAPGPTTEQKSEALQPLSQKARSRRPRSPAQGLWFPEPSATGEAATAGAQVHSCPRGWARSALRRSGQMGAPGPAR